MDATHSMISFLEKAGKISPEIQASIACEFAALNLGKNEFYLREGEVCKHLGFVSTGLLMYYKMDDHGTEIVTDFAQENSWVSHYQSFINREPSAIFIKALEPCTVYTISLDKLSALYTTIPGFEQFARQIIEATFMEMINRQLAFQSLNAEGRYAKFIDLYPDLLQRVPQYYIASFLNIAPPSLSRIRKNWSS